MSNPVVWFEIYVSDMNRAKRFYEELLDVNLSRLESEIEMWGFPSAGDGLGCSGSLVKMPGLTPSGLSTLVYFTSDDCATLEKKAEKLGGKIHKPKSSIGQYGFMSLVIDTEGTMIGIHSMK